MDFDISGIDVDHRKRYAARVLHPLGYMKLTEYALQSTQPDDTVVPQLPYVKAQGVLAEALAPRFGGLTASTVRPQASVSTMHSAWLGTMFLRRLPSCNSRFIYPI